MIKPECTWFNIFDGLPFLSTHSDELFLFAFHWLAWFAWCWVENLVKGGKWLLHSDHQRWSKMERWADADKINHLTKFFKNHKIQSKLFFQKRWNACTRLVVTCCGRISQFNCPVRQVRTGPFYTTIFELTERFCRRRSTIAPGCKRIFLGAHLKAVFRTCWDSPSTDWPADGLPLLSDGFSWLFCSEKLKNLWMTRITPQRSSWRQQWTQMCLNFSIGSSLIKINYN